MGANTNVLDYVPDTIALGEVIVRKLTDLPAPIGGIITLADQSRYTIKGPVNIGTNRFEFAGSGDVIFQGVNNRFNNITYEGTGALFSNPTPINRIVVLEMTFISTGVGATLYDLTSDGAGNSTLFTRSTGYIGFDNFGTVRGFPIFVIKESTINGLVSGLNLVNCSINQFESAVFQGTFAGSDAHLRFTGSGTNVIFADINVLIPLGGESSFFISPTISPNGVVNISKSITLGNGSFFESGATGSITLFADASISLTSVDTVSDDGEGNAEFNVSGTVPVVGQRVVLQNFTTETSYNQTIIVATITASSFTGIIESSGLPLEFTNNDTSGDYQSDSVVVTSTAHGRSNADSLLIAATIGYNAGYDIFNALTNTFQIHAVFATAETVGTWDTGSITQTERRMELSQNGAQAASMNVAFGGMNGNVGATTISSADTYQALDFNTMVQSPISERWTLIDVTNGIFRYDGFNPTTGTFAASITIVKSGSTEVYRFSVAKNGAIPVFATAAHVPVEVKTTQINATLIAPISVVPGDTIQVMGAGEGTTNSVTITDFFLEMIF